ncbi:MAG: histidine--tRNA ligase [Gammaproteobacteria bacterium]|nr:histidine--tRNA ligase [Gammaproteobacteria bacterium]
MRNIQSVRGMNDLLPDQTAVWHRVEAVLREVSEKYGYQEIRTPVVEKTALFTQSIGDQTDIVEKEMYTFVDAGEESLTLRPESTASTVRACIQHGLIHNRQIRLWYMGPMFRRERPQRGRYRQFHQFGVEALGWPGPDIDGEIIRIGERIWKELGIQGIILEINTLGSERSRTAYRQALTGFLTENTDSLDEVSLRRLHTNPLRILDSKNPQIQAILKDAPVLQDFMEANEQEHFESLCNSLAQSGISYRINPRLVRGLDYYSGTVFEWITDRLGAQSAVCAGGRYDKLITNRGGKDTPAVGFAMGLERLIELAMLQSEKVEAQPVHAYMIDLTDSSEVTIRIAEKLRDKGLNVIEHCGEGKLGNQLKKADQSGAALALIRGQDEAESGVIQLKHLRENKPHSNVPVEEVVEQCVKTLM